MLNFRLKFNKLGSEIKISKKQNKMDNRYFESVYVNLLAKNYISFSVLINFILNWNGIAFFNFNKS